MFIPTKRDEDLMIVYTSVPFCSLINLNTIFHYLRQKKRIISFLKTGIRKLDQIVS